MLRFKRAAPLATAFFFLAVSCGGDDATGGSSGGSAGPNFPTTPGSGGSSVDANGNVSTSNSRSCNGKPGADKHCGGDPSDETKLGSQDCCETRVVQGGSYNRFNNKDYPAKVASFKLDTFLVTGGRIRAWVDSLNGNLASAAPAPGAGANPQVPNSGWRSEWNRFLPASKADVDGMFGPEYDTDGPILACQYGTDLEQFGALTWWTKELQDNVTAENKGEDGGDDVIAANTQDELDRKPINCIPWHVLFAFCIWDGGRLPTDAEFGYAAAGGQEQRDFPWGSVDEIAHINNDVTLSQPPTFDAGKKYVAARLWDKTINDGKNKFEDNYGLTWGNHVFGKADNAAHVMPVGRRPAGNGKWGQADLASDMFEWMLDEGPVRPGTCNNCAAVNWPAITNYDPKVDMDNQDYHNQTPGGQDWYRGGARVIRGGGWDNAILMANAQSQSEIEYYTSYPVLRSYRALGGRCARDIGN
jgi:formylglycine-generating enzyme required for sulfatase activity